MDLSGKCKLLTIYINEDAKYDGHNLYHYLVLKLKEMGVAGVTVSRGLESYGKNKRLHTAKILDLSLSLPIIVEVIDTEEQIDRILPIVKSVVNGGLITLTSIEVVQYGK
ncbi:MAG: DUF190 domain-containing protein [Candidatus Margulisiibacteriota bacterium]|nr:MAG: hypothetical protein A2X43_04985 [Candidatus Margulisbacteria bacterium GWD2_39_127]OGI03604.1 MAG: hypothetical protein A2X42_01070 [Candidatus Margulisbacteria bacterium GWF2_38_17]OGI11108.1 MAG: hypothetical protein A2X41_02365 [Candidatus Margulisbacteria bacterium GWE2_39_32]PZM78144.1 MAG: DUF190 domain-containing protein [Candidatus Margulisiibacteriota bacterium]HAR64384.1 hypothetical protein [Candidatus Margulisiibacteriota bacterium]